MNEVSQFLGVIGIFIQCALQPRNSELHNYVHAVYGSDVFEKECDSL